MSEDEHGRTHVFAREIAAFALLLFSTLVYGQTIEQRVAKVNTALNAARAAMYQVQAAGKAPDADVIYVRSISELAQEHNNTAFVHWVGAEGAVVKMNEEHLRAAEVLTEELLGYMARKGIQVNQPPE